MIILALDTSGLVSVAIAQMGRWCATTLHAV